VNKAAAALVLAVALWVVTSVALPVTDMQLSLAEVGAEIFSIIVFLLTAMTLIEILIHYHFFDLMERWLRDKDWTQRQLAWAVAGMAFVFSAFIDNLTTTIVAIQFTRRMFKHETRLIIGALVVIVANAGGAFSPIGDVTTLMLWFAKKFTAEQIIFQGLLPSVTLGLVASWWLIRKIGHKPCTADCAPFKVENLQVSHTDKLVIAATLASFLLPLLASGIGLPPYMGLVAGLGLVWLLIDVVRRARPQETHLQANIKKFLQHTDIESIQFFIGILLAVGALHALGVLKIGTNWLLGSAPDIPRYLSAFVSLGLASAIVDNVPITAAAISSLQGVPATMWVLFALVVGTGGSMLVIGSAAGVIAMGMLPKLTFGKYIKIGTVPALLGFVAAIVVWGLQYLVFFR